MGDEFLTERLETLDEDLGQGDVFGTVEAVKTVSDLFMPVSGKIIEFNEELESNPEVINEDPYGKGWMIKIELSDMSEAESLLSSDNYSELVG